MSGMFKFTVVKIRFVIFFFKFKICVKFIALSRQYNKVPDWNSCKNFIVSYKKIDLYSAYLFHPKTAATIRQKWQSVEKILS